MHQFGPWAYIEEGSCRQQRVCRCGESKDNRINHTWRIEGSHEACRVCERCREIDSHDWEVIETIETSEIVGERYIGTGTYTAAYATIDKVKCKKCGLEEVHD